MKGCRISGVSAGTRPKSTCLGWEERRLLLGSKELGRQNTFFPSLCSTSAFPLLATQPSRSAVPKDSCHLQWTSAGEVFFDVDVPTLHLKSAWSPRAMPE